MARRFEFHRRNLLNTLGTLFATAGQTGTATALFDRDISLRWASSGYNGATSLVLSVNFASATVIDHIMLLNHNLRQFRVFYNSLTANTFTPAINVSGASNTFSYFAFNTITVSSIDLQMDIANTTTVAGSSTTEKVLGEFIVTRNLLTATVRNPAADNYRPVLRRVGVRHEMADGGSSFFYFADKFQADIRLSNITTAFKDDLDELYDDALPFIFIPLATTGSTWDGDAFEVEWTGANDFKWAGNDKNAQGWNGGMRLEQTYGGIGRRP